MKDSIKITWIIVSAVFVLALIVGLIYWSLNAPRNEISVTGQASIKAMPDLVSVYFTIETSGASAQIANDKNSNISDEVIKNLIGAGLVREEITTENFNIYYIFSIIIATITLTLLKFFTYDRFLFKEKDVVFR